MMTINSVREHIGNEYDNAISTIDGMIVATNQLAESMIKAHTKRVAFHLAEIEKILKGNTEQWKQIQEFRALLTAWTAEHHLCESKSEIWDYLFVLDDLELRTKLILKMAKTSLATRTVAVP